MNLICRIAGHRHSRKRVWNDGMSFRATCTRCSRPLIRDESEWRTFSQQDYDARRQAKPLR